MIDLEWLRTFGAIYECSNITEASKKLNMTQPGVSKHLSALENYVGRKLFDRTTRKVAPTEYGKFLYAQINHPLQQLQKVEHYASQRVKKQRLAISIGCTLDFFNDQLIDKMYAFDMYIVTLFGTENELVEALEKDKIQLIVGVKKHKLYNHEFSHIKTEELILISSYSVQIPAEIEGNNNQLRQWLQKQTWFVFDNDLADLRLFWETNFNQSPKIVPRYILPSYLKIIEVLTKNSGVGIVPKHYCKDLVDESLIKEIFHTPDKTEQNLFYAFKPENRNLKEINQFIDKMNI